MSSSDHSMTVETENRKFDVKILKYENAFFISISEGLMRIGGMIISIATGPTPVSSEIIPIRADLMFLKLISQKMASEVRGICVVSLSAQKELGAGPSKVLIEKITEAIRK
ncbi:hypothetical protein [Candidatus Nitrosotenuis aquarius]|uniref:hypothetical protein n=1 Tax=Candidatus Nitrosotenuis aquarius TaxID=1846278 RepID=UPI000C1EF7DA|nr:hypothetical protein [Candidatus Nitrosotenuis aquarius]